MNRIPFLVVAATLLGIAPLAGFRCTRAAANGTASWAPPFSSAMTDATAKLWAAYERDGYAIVRGFLTERQVARLSDAVDAVEAEANAKGASWRHGNLAYRVVAGGDGGARVRMAQWMAYTHAAFDELRTDARYAELLAPRLGGDVKQIINQLHWKPPSAATNDFAFHQDSRFRRPYEAFRNLARSYVQTGIAIDPHGPESGGMRFLPRSHEAGDLELGIEGEVMGGDMADGALARAGLDPKATVDLELEPGDLALWSPYLVHGSGTNRSRHQRRFLINGYVRAADCDRGEWAFRGGAPVQLAGTPALIHFEALHERPEPHYT